MKNTYSKSINIFLMLICITSCESILDKEPIGILDSGSFFQTEADAIQAINAAYRPLTFSSANANFYWAFGVIASDEAITGGDGSRPGLTEIDGMTFTPRTQELNDFWILEYAGITQCNLVLDKINKISFNQVAKNRIIGEALFLRSFYYFQLTQVFGDVPVYTTLVPPDLLRIAKTPKAEIYSVLIEDLDKAATLLPLQYTTDDLGRASQGAAIALANKVSIYQKNWLKALEYTAKLKALNVYALVPDYGDNFKKNTQNNSESIWEIQHTNLELGVGNSLNQWWFSKKAVGGYGFAEMTASFVSAFENDDPRRAATVAMNNEEYFGLEYKNSFSSTRYSIRKYLQAIGSVTQKADGDINYTPIRYAEVLLWEAEALAELNRVNEAILPLEMVRARARAKANNPGTALPKMNNTDKTSMINAIRHERQVELGFEMHRYFDLVRWGIAAEFITGFVPGKHEVFPIPQTELDLNPFLKQNPGY